MTTLPELSRVLSYSNSSVVDLYKKENPEMSLEEIKQLFQDLLGWLWLSEHRLQRQLKTHMIAPLAKLDTLWHCFILHTEDYTTFCHTYFNRYIHHVVEPVGFEYTLSSDELSAYLSDCFDLLGEGWLLRNFSV